MNDSLTAIFEEISRTEQLPVIFAGSGVSKRYTTNKFDWKGLLIRCISEYCEDLENKYREYHTKIKYQLEQQGEMMASSINEAIGSEIEKDFNLAYYRKELRNVSVPTDSNPLKFFISTLLQEYTLDEGMNDEIRLFKSLESKMLTVVTTNYDSFFENHIFTKHEKIVGQDVFSKSEMGTLFKIHGCVSQPDSIVITKNDYDIFKKKRKILSAKLIGLFTENPVIFLGYSLHDENIKSILMDIFECLDNPTEVSLLEQRLIIINYDEGSENPVIGTHSLAIGSIQINMTKVTLSSYLPLLTEMQQLSRKVKFKELKLIKDLVYEVVHSEEGASKKLVNLVDDDELTDGNEIIVAITKKDDVLSTFGIIGLSKEALFDDLLHNNLVLSKAQKKILIENHVPNLLKGNVSQPIHKYLRELEVDSIHLDESVKELINKQPEDYLNKAIKAYRDGEYSQYSSMSLNEIWELDISGYKKTHIFVLRSIDSPDPEEIKEFLLKHEDDIKSINGGHTFFRKMVCIYDIRKYKTPIEGSASYTHTSR